jgi:signal transduction histidine kinase
MARTNAKEADQIAALFASDRAKLTAAGKALHDEVGSLISAAGLHLQMLRDDTPAAAQDLTKVLEMMEQATEQVRRISQDLDPVPAARWGLKGALISLETYHESVSVTCGATPRFQDRVVAALYEAAAAAVAAAVDAGASRVDVAASGSVPISIRVSDNGRARGRARALAVAALLARQARVAVTVRTGRNTTVWIKYAVRRAAG